MLEYFRNLKIEIGVSSSIETPINVSIHRDSN